MLKINLCFHWPFLLFAVLLCFGLDNTSTQAEDKPTQQHQIIYQVDYIPLKLGASTVGQPLIQVNINGTPTATFLVDTGTSYTTISTELARQMHLHMEPEIGVDGKPVLWEGKQAVVTRVSTLKIGTLSFTDFPLVVLDSKEFSLSLNEHDTGPYTGIIGDSLLQQFAILLDGQKHTFAFCLPGNLSQQQVGLLGMSQPYFLPLTNADNYKWFVQAQFVNGGYRSSENMLVDTGSDITKVSEKLAQKIKLKALGQEITKDVYGIGTATTTTTDELHLGELNLLDSPLVIRPASENLPSLLGINILSNYRVLMDFPAKKMYLQSNAAVPAITVGPAPAVITPPAK